MKKFKNFSLSLVTTTLLSSVLIGCGGGGGGSSSNDSSPTISTATLSDSQISGVTYTCGSTTGLTTSEGKFTYTDACDTIEFSIGDLKLGSINRLDIKNDATVYPADLLGLSRSNTSDDKLVNILRVLQTLDTDNNPNNGINIDNNTQTKLTGISEVNLTNDTVTDGDLTTIINTVDNTKTLINKDYAIAHYEDTLRKNLNSTIDTVVPAPAILKSNILPVNTDTTEVIVNGEVGAKVFIDGVDSGITIDDSNSATLTLDTSGIEETKTFNITLKDNKQTGSSDPLTVNVIKDTTPPTTATNSTIPTYVNSNTSNKDLVSTTISGEDGAKVFIDGSEVGTISNGSFDASLDTSGVDGIKSFDITLKDLAGNVSNALSLSITKDTTPPTTATNSTIPTYVNSNTSNKDLVSTTISGEDGAKVFVNGSEVGTISNGSFDASLDTSGVDGIKSFDITLKDLAGNVSDALSLSITKDTTPPTQATSNNIPTYVNSNSSNKDLVSTTISGEDGAKVFVNGSEVGTISNGTFELTLDMSGPDGDKSFNVTLEDLAGNISTALAFIINKDTIAPIIPTVTSTAEVLNDNITLNIQGEAGAEILVNNVSYNKLASSGALDIQLSNPNNSYYETFTITLVDAAGNISKEFVFTTTFSRFVLNNTTTYFAPEDINVVKNSTTNEEAIIMSYNSDEAVGGSIAKIVVDPSVSINDKLNSIISDISNISGLNTPSKLLEEKITKTNKEGLIAEYTVNSSSNIGSIKLISDITNKIMGGTLTNLPTVDTNALLSTYFNIKFYLEKDSSGLIYITISVVPNSQYLNYQTIFNSIINIENIKDNNEILANTNDTFTVNSTTDKKSADFLFVVDDSGSMSSYQNAVSQAANDFSDAIVNTGINYRVGIITTSQDIDDSCSDYISSSDANRVLCDSNVGIISNDVDKFKTNVVVGTNGSYTETGIYNAEYALQSVALGDSKDGILTTLGMPENGSSLSIIILSDEESQYTDRSSGSFDPTNNIFIDRNYTVNSIVDSNDASESYYDDLAYNTKGLVADISSTTNYSIIMNAIAQKAIGNAGYKLSNENVVESTIYVKVNDVEVPHSNSNGWKYNAAYNSILFYGTAVPNNNDEIKVSYSYTKN